MTCFTALDLYLLSSYFPYVSALRPSSEECVAAEVVFFRLLLRIRPATTVTAMRTKKCSHTAAFIVFNDPN